MSYDRKGIPIRSGDVLKVFHFIGARNKRHYMYKLAWLHTLPDGKSYLMGCHLGMDAIGGCTISNSYVLPNGILEDYEIVSGYNNIDEELDFNDRPRVLTKEISNG